MSTAKNLRETQIELYTSINALLREADRVRSLRDQLKRLTTVKRHPESVGGD